MEPILENVKLTKNKDKKASLMKKTIHGNEEKKAIAIDMLERYTGHDLKFFQKQIIITNYYQQQYLLYAQLFQNYV